MGLKLRALRIEVSTPVGPFGMFTKLDPGLVVLRADNTSGKSTCVQAIVWALGLEGMYGPSKTPPLTPAVLKQIEDEVSGDELPVLESSVYLEVENGRGQTWTLRRWMMHPRISTDLIETWDDGLLTEPGASARQRDYYVRLAGAAQAESGFHAALAKFLGWQLPTVLRNDGSLSLLYLEAIFPVALVEQKRGWSGLFAVMPWYLRVPDVAARAVEFALNLDAYDSARRRRELRAESESLSKDWAHVIAVFRDRLVGHAGALHAVPSHPTTEWPQAVAASISIASTDGTAALPAVLRRLRAELQEISKGEVPTVGEISERATAELADKEQRLQALQSLAAQTAEELAVLDEQRASLITREKALRTDLSRYNDVQRLQELGSTLMAGESSGECPTCHQDLPDSLLSRLEAPVTMAPGANISLIREQLRALELIRSDLDKRHSGSSRRLAAIRNESSVTRSEIRSLRRTLVSDSRLPAAATIERQIRLAEHISRLEELEIEFAGLLEKLAGLSARLRTVASELAGMGPEGLSASDLQVLRDVEQSFKTQLGEYGFRSYRLDAISLSAVKYTPQRDDVELSYGLSASDLIRTIWAYLLALFEVGVPRGHHPGFLIFDEPRQQDAAQVSFDALLRRAVVSAQEGQVIVATSDEEVNVRSALAGSKYQYIGFEGRVLKNLQAGSG
jgi:hypothetical protein